MIICNDSVLIHFHIFQEKEAEGATAASSQTPAEDVSLFFITVQCNRTENVI